MVVFVVLGFGVACGYFYGDVAGFRTGRIVVDASVVSPVGYVQGEIEVVSVCVADGQRVSVVVVDLQIGGVAVGRRGFEGHLVGYFFIFCQVHLVGSFQDQVPLVFLGAGVAVEGACLYAQVGVVALESAGGAGDEFAVLRRGGIAIDTDGEEGGTSSCFSHRYGFDGELGCFSVIDDVEPCGYARQLKAYLHARRAFEVRQIEWGNVGSAHGQRRGEHVGGFGCGKQGCVIGGKYALLRLPFCLDGIARFGEYDGHESSFGYFIAVGPDQLGLVGDAI